MVTGVIWTDCDDHFVVYRNTESLCYAPGNDIVL